MGLCRNSVLDLQALKRLLILQALCRGRSHDPQRYSSSQTDSEAPTSEGLVPFHGSPHWDTAQWLAASLNGNCHLSLILVSRRPKSHAAQKQTIWAPGSGMNTADEDRRALLFFERWVHVPMLENLFQIRPYAQVSDVIGDGRKSVRHALRDDDDVTRLYVAARVSHHRAPAGRAV